TTQPNAARDDSLILARVRHYFLRFIWGNTEREESLAGEQGFEPQLPDPESGVLPLDDSPMLPESIPILRRRVESFRSPSHHRAAARTRPAAPQLHQPRQW